LFLIYYFEIALALCDLYLTRFVLIKGAEERLLLETKALHTKKYVRKNRYLESKKDFEHIELPAKQLY